MRDVSFKTNPFMSLFNRQKRSLRKEAFRVRKEVSEKLRMVVQPVFFGNGTDDAAGVSGSEAVWGNISGNDAARTDDAACPDHYIAADCYAGSDPAVVPDRDVCPEIKLDRSLQIDIFPAVWKKLIEDGFPLVGIRFGRAVVLAAKLMCPCALFRHPFRKRVVQLSGSHFFPFCHKNGSFLILPIE